MREMTSDNGWVNLANSIVLQAAQEYRGALRSLNNHDPSCRYPDATEDYLRRKSYRLYVLERFFFSEWCSVLTRVDRQALVEQLRKEVDYERVSVWREQYKVVKVNEVRRRSRRN